MHDQRSAYSSIDRGAQTSTFTRHNLFRLSIFAHANPSPENQVMFMRSVTCAERVAIPTVILF